VHLAPEPQGNAVHASTSACGTATHCVQHCVFEKQSTAFLALQVWMVTADCTVSGTLSKHPHLHAAQQSRVEWKLGALELLRRGASNRWSLSVFPGFWKARKCWPSTGQLLLDNLRPQELACAPDSCDQPCTKQCHNLAHRNYMVVMQKSSTFTHQTAW
jgi:hypothetical protein